MSNVLKVSLQTTIYSLADRGWSRRRIASELGINRETVRRYLRLANPAISIAGSEEGADRKPAISITGKQAGATQSKPAISIAGIGAGRRNRCECLAEVIAAKLDAGLSARRIYQDLWSKPTSVIPINRCSVLFASLKRRSRSGFGAWKLGLARKYRSTRFGRPD